LETAQGKEKGRHTGGGDDERESLDESPANDFLGASSIAGKLDDLMAALPEQRRTWMEDRAMKL
jgi:hypothetical protein